MYLDGYANKFGLYDHINFRTKVLKVTKCHVTNKWLVTTKSNAFFWPHRSTFLLPRHLDEEIRRKCNQEHGPKVLADFYGRAEKEGFESVKLKYKYEYYCHVTGELKVMCPSQVEQGVIKTYAVDQLAVCTGTNTWASLPTFDGQENFKGKIVHSENYKKPEVFKGQRVLVIGAGESGSDICNEIAGEASKVAIVVRNKHGHLIPRKQADGRVTDLNTNRCRYSNPYILGDWVGWANQHAKKFVAKHGNVDKPLAERQILQKIGELNLSQGTSAFSKFGCKNEGFVTAMVTKGAELHRDAFMLTADKKACFKDGTEFQCDAIVACTGYKNSFPFFEHPEVCDKLACFKCGMKTKEIAQFGMNPRRLYKQVFCPIFDDGSVAFFGFARPAFGSIPPTVEMQSRLFAMVQNGKKLPSTDEMECIAKKDQANWEWRFGYDAKRVKGLVDFQLYCDELAAEIGCLPPLTHLFFSKPMIWWKIMFSSFTMHQYRLVGPYANPAVCEPVYKKSPAGDFLECSITAAFLITAKILSILGFKQFTPNNF